MTQIPLFQTPSEWTPPEKVPNLSEAKEIAVDLETYDPDIKTKGPGWAINNGYIAGVAIAVEGWKGYFPIRHEGGGNFDEGILKRQIQKIMDLPCDKVFHNAAYDVGWLRWWGVEVKGKIIDTLIAAPLIDENRFRYSLNELGKDYLKETKSEALLYEAAKEWGVDAKAQMYKLPAMYVGPYAEQDADLTLRLWQYFKVELIKQELSSIFDLETRLFPCLLDMKSKGVRVDLDKADRIKKDLQKKETTLLKQIKKDTGVDVDIWAAVSVAKAFDKLNIKYERTEKSEQPKFDKNFLTTHKHPLAKMVVQAREFNKARTTFIDTILRHSSHSRIHADINQMRSNEGTGTVTGRFSYNNPNLQQIPARNKDIGPLIRSIFVPDEGCKWGSFDYSQQEPRVLVHFAALTGGGLKGADEVIESYKTEDPDFHQAVADMAGIDRSTAKTINLGMMYGMGKGKLSSELGLDRNETEDLFAKFHANVPFVKQLMEQATRKADNVGFLRTLLGRKCRFDLWEPRAFGIHKALPLWEAEKEYGRDLKRAWTYKALNRLIQGSSADMTKKAMVDLYEEGIVSHIQVHDELNCSIESEEQAKRIKEIMETTVELKVPLKVDAEIGPSWGEIKKK
jgi:DNA polymerase I-like protein with 3'-5' exonuclease and polymerase domains